MQVNVNPPPGPPQPLPHDGPTGPQGTEPPFSVQGSPPQPPQAVTDYEQVLQNLAWAWKNLNNPAFEGPAEDIVSSYQAQLLQIPNPITDAVNSLNLPSSQASQLIQDLTGGNLKTLQTDLANEEASTNPNANVISILTAAISVAKSIPPLPSMGGNA